MSCWTSNIVDERNRSDKTAKLEQAMVDIATIEENGPQNFLLSWKGFQRNIVGMLQSLNPDKEFLTDMTIACEGGFRVKLHKIILASSSPYFQHLLEFSEAKHPIVVLGGISPDVLKLMVEYIYCGKTSVLSNNLYELISAAKYLQIQGLQDLNLDNTNQALDLSLSSMGPRPNLPLQVNTTASSSSFMMSPPSECDLTPRSNAEPSPPNGAIGPELKHESVAVIDDDEDEHPLVMSIPDEENTATPYHEMVKPEPATYLQNMSLPDIKIQPVKDELQFVSTGISQEQMSPNWNDGCEMLHLLAMAADIRSSSLQKEQVTNQESSVFHRMSLSNDNSPTFYSTTDNLSSIPEKSKQTEITTSNESSPITPTENFDHTEYSSNSGHTAISAVSAVTSIGSSTSSISRQHPYFKFDIESKKEKKKISKEKSMNQPRSTAAYNAAEPVNFTINPVSPQLGFSNSATFWPVQQTMSAEFYQLLPFDQPTASNDKVTQQKIVYGSASDYSIQRLTSNSTAASALNPGKEGHYNSGNENRDQASRVVSSRRLFTAPPSPHLEHQYSRSNWMTTTPVSTGPAKNKTVAISLHTSTPRVPTFNLIQGSASGSERVPSQANSNNRRSVPSTSSSTGGASSHDSRKSCSPTPSCSGSTWKSRQPTECHFCNRMFSNKFNLKQHVLNMHSKGGEVRCMQCGKMVKNKWYMRRHNVTHHGAPLRKLKKERNSNHSDTEY